LVAIRLIFNKLDGTISTFPKPDYDFKKQNRFRHFDEKNNRFLIVENKKLFWYDAKKNKELLHSINTKSRYLRPITNFKHNIVVPIIDYHPEIDSTKINWKFLSINENEVAIVNSFEKERRTPWRVWKWNDNSLGLIQTFIDTCKMSF